MSKRQLKRYTQEFKDRAVELMNSTDQSVPEIAEQLDVNPKNLYNWRAQAQANKAGGKSPEMVTLQNENKQLRKELARLQEEQIILKKAAFVLCQGHPVKYAFIQQQRRYHSIEYFCCVLGVSKSGYYGWLNRRESARAEENRLLGEWIVEIFYGSRATYGSKRIQCCLVEHGVRVSRRRVARIKRKLGLECKAQRCFKVITTDSSHSLPVAPNHLNREFTAERPDQAYVGDITYTATKEGWLYLAVWIGLFSRSVVGWFMADHMKASLVTDALRMACFKRRPPVGLMVHSDRGSQYASNLFSGLLKEKGYLQSMSRLGDCWDNAPAESFFGTLKTELIGGFVFNSYEEAKQAIFEYIEVFYNRQRKHSTIGYMTPEQCDLAFPVSA
ncbi:IS3 family transposase [Magnetococcus sp. PR-3]|uniref:IS3 family transposase n=1 Tax=Magnetococcus sp. PR-3 TaxID=3120355 RepID=UPI002FCE08FD